MAVVDQSSATVLHSHNNGGSVLLGDETGRLTAIGWDFERADSMIDQPDGTNGTINVRKVDLGVVSNCPCRPRDLC